MLRIDPEKEVTPLQNVSMSNKGVLEEHLREWIINNPKPILGEELLLIGREAMVKNIGDAVDLLGIDRDGNVVIIELKKGALKGTVDFQGMKYAAYTSQWNYSELRDQFENFQSTAWGKDRYDEVTFTELLDEFCNEDYTLNQDQRIVLIGESVGNRLDFVLRWLSDREVDVTVIEYQLLTEEDRTYLEVEQVIPVPEHTSADVGPRPQQPWKEDGRSWHLDERTSEKTGNLLEEFVENFSDIESLDGPAWTQKPYVSFKQGRKLRVVIRTFKNLLHVDIYDIPEGRTTVAKLSDILDIPEDRIVVGEIPHAAHPGIRITCMSDQEIDVGAIVEETRRLLADSDE